MLKTIKKYHNLVFLLLSIFLITPSLLGLLHVGFPLTDDGNWMVIRFSAFYEALRSGQFPVRFLERLNNGYGYPVADFLYPLFMYIGVPIHIIGFSFVNTIKILIALSLLSSCVFTFLWLRKIFDNLESFVGAVFYTLFPYLLFDIYTRGSVGEVLSLAVLPFVLWQIERKNFLLTSLGLAALIIAHNTLALLFMPFIVTYIYLRNKRVSKQHVLSILFGLGISSFFWIPAVYDLQYTVFSTTKVSDVTPYFINNNLGLLGITSFFVFLEGIFYLLRKKDKFFLILFLIFIILSFFTLSYSSVLWKALPFTSLIQFPFRIISLIIPLGAFMVAYLLDKEKAFKKTILIIIYLLFIFIAGYAYITPKNLQNYPDTFYSTNLDTTTVKNEYMPKWVKDIPKAYNPNRVEVIGGEEKINLQKLNSNEIQFYVFLNTKKTIQVNMIYFPGWSAQVNGISREILYNNPGGLIRLNLNRGENNVKIMFVETPIRIFSDFISLFSIFGVFTVYVFNKKKIKI